MIPKEKLYVGKDGRGIPYTLSEARHVAETHADMDEYHREIMCWLIYEVERLKKEVKGVNEDLDMAQHEIDNHG